MIFTNEKPTQPGAYWVTCSDLTRPALVEVHLFEGELWCSLHQRTTFDVGQEGFGYAVADLHTAFKWAGPLVWLGEASGAPPRYELGQCERFHESSDGGWVKWEDHRAHDARLQAALEAAGNLAHARADELEQLQAEVDALRLQCGGMQMELDERAELLGQVKEAYQFLKKCREDKTDAAIDTGALRDAHEWLRKAAEALGEALAGGKEHE